MFFYNIYIYKTWVYSSFLNLFTPKCKKKKKRLIFFYLSFKYTLNYGVLCVYGLNSFSLFAVSKVWQHILFIYICYTIENH